MKNQYLLNRIFFFSLSLLILNDHFLKAEYPGWLTGKLSDVSGLVVFVLLFSVFVRDSFRKHLYLSVAALFVFWKSEWSAGFIVQWNTVFDFWPLQRAADHTDIVCLLILIPLYHYRPQAHKFILRKELITYPLMGVTVFAIMATSRAIFWKDGTDIIYVGEFVHARMTRTELLKQLNRDGIKFEQDSFFVYARDTFDRYLLRDIYLGQDSLRSAIIGIRDKRKKVEIFIQKIVLSNKSKHFETYKEYQKWQKKYRIEAEDFFRNIDEREKTGPVPDNFD